MASSTFTLPFLILGVALTISIFPVYGQVSSPCTASMLTSFSTPCMNFLTNSSANGTSPTSDCCNSVKSLTSSGMDCLRLVVTASVPFQIPINRTLAISLPRTCNMPGVPVQCKASVAPIPAPASDVPESTPSVEAPVTDITSVLTPSSTEGSAATTGSRPVLTPSAAMPSNSISLSLLVVAVGFVVLKHYH